MYTLVACLMTAPIFIIIGYYIGRKKQRWIENIGEAAVRKMLLQKFPGSDYHLMNNITLPLEDGTTQIDHILISRYGIFVIESKHYAGWIFGDENSHTWTQVIYNFRSRFMNPIHQNYKHIIAISKLLDFIPRDYIHSIVVFTGKAEFKTKCPPGVVWLYGLSDFINDFNQAVISENRMQFCVGRIETIRKIISNETDVEHHEYLLNKHYNKIHRN